MSIIRKAVYASIFGSDICTPSCCEADTLIGNKADAGTEKMAEAANNCLTHHIIHESHDNCKRQSA